MINVDEQQHDVLRPLALLATGRTGADIERVVREVRRKARREQRGIAWTDLEQALLAGQMRMSDDLRWRTAASPRRSVLTALVRLQATLTITCRRPRLG